MKDRIKQLIDALGVSGREFSTSVGQSTGWSRAISNTIGADVMYNIIRRYPQVNAFWLMSGEGEMFQENEANSITPKETSTFSVNNDYRLICEELRHDNKELREENKNIRELLLKEMQKNQELLIENTQLKVKSYKAGDQ